MTTPRDTAPIVELARGAIGRIERPDLHLPAAPGWYAYVRRIDTVPASSAWWEVELCNSNPEAERELVEAEFVPWGEWADVEFEAWRRRVAFTPLSPSESDRVARELFASSAAEHQAPNARQRRFDQRFARKMAAERDRLIALSRAGDALLAAPAEAGSARNSAGSFLDWPQLSTWPDAEHGGRIVAVRRPESWVPESDHWYAKVDIVRWPLTFDHQWDVALRHPRWDVAADALNQGAELSRRLTTVAFLAWAERAGMQGLDESTATQVRNWLFPGGLDPTGPSALLTLQTFGLAP